MSYRPSGDVEAVLAEILAGGGDGLSNLAAHPARALSPETVGAEHVAAGQVGSLSFPAGDDAAAVEHEAKRQAWLARWQRER